MHMIVATTAHLATDVRVKSKIVDGLTHNGWHVKWIGPRANEVGVPCPDVHEGVEYVWLPEVSNRISRMTMPTRLRTALRRLPHGANWIYVPDPDALGPARSLRNRTGSRVWFDIHERYHNEHAQAWLGPADSDRAREYLRRWISRGAANADLVTSPSPAVLDDYAPEHPNSHILLNSARSDFARGVEGAHREVGTRMRIMHGKPGTYRGTAEIAGALEVLEALGRDVTVVCLGFESDLEAAIGVERAAALTAMDRHARFELVGPVSHAEMPTLTARCHAGIVGYTGSLAPASFPNRLFEYMAVGIPVLGPVESPYIAQTIRQAQAGLTYSNSNIDSLARAIDWLWDSPSGACEMGRHGRDAFYKGLTWEAQMEALMPYLLMANGPGPN